VKQSEQTQYITNPNQSSRCTDDTAAASKVALYDKAQWSSDG